MAEWGAEAAILGVKWRTFFLSLRTGMGPLTAPEFGRKNSFIMG